MKKKFHPIRWLYKFTQDLVIIDPENHSLLLVKFFRLLGTPLLIAFAIDDFVHGSLLDGIVTTVTLSIFIISFSFLERFQNHLLFFRVVFTIMILNFSYVIISSPNYYVASLWMLMLPIPLAFIFGTKEGSIWIIVGFFATLISTKISIYQNAFLNEFLLRHLIIYFILGSLAIIVEAVRSKVQGLYVQKQIELEKLNKQLYKNSIRDSLTGCYNRSFLSDPLEKIISQSIRLNSPLSIILLDIDRFKSVNDECGHITGDKALVIISDTIRSNLKRRSDSVIRYGGDEFLIVLPDTHLENARLLATKIRNSLSEIRIPNCTKNIKASFGLVDVLSVAENYAMINEELITTLIAIADKNLYKAKAFGGDKVVAEIR